MRFSSIDFIHIPNVSSLFPYNIGLVKVTYSLQLYVYSNWNTKYGTYSIININMSANKQING